MQEPPIVIRELRHSYGSRELYNDLSLQFEKGQIYALLGKNGVGKTTLIQILMGFLRPTGGSCHIFGDASHAIQPATRRRIGLLFERHLAYDFFTIEQAEKFTKQFYPKWRAECYYDLIECLGLPKKHRIAHMSEGQRSQVVLGLILAQDPELLILDDYSMGLDAGYRRLFIDYLCEHLRDGKHTIVVTSHVIQDMESFVDEALFMRRDKPVYRSSLAEFMGSFSCYTLPLKSDNEGIASALSTLSTSSLIANVEWHRDHVELFTFADEKTFRSALFSHGLCDVSFEKKPMDVEDAFIGFTGRY